MAGLSWEKKVRWDWEMFGVGDVLTVKGFEENKRILVEWENESNYCRMGALSLMKMVQH